MSLTKPFKLSKQQANLIKTSSGEFLEYMNWQENKDLAVGMSTHHKRFPGEGNIVSQEVDEMIILKDGKGSVVVMVDDKENKFELKKDAIVFIPRKAPFHFEPDPSMEIISITCPAWYPEQQEGLDYERV